MADLAAHLVDHVFPFVPVRQWVLTLPFRIRYLVAFDRDLCREVRAVFLRTLLTWIRSRARRRGIQDGRSGAVTFTQRFGSSVNLNPHFHALVLDGVFCPPGYSTGRPSFHPARSLDDSDVEHLLERVRNRLLALLRRRGHLDDEGLLGRTTQPCPVLQAEQESAHHLPEGPPGGPERRG